MEEFLKKLLEGQEQLFEGQKQLFEGQKRLLAEVGDIKTQLKHIDNRLTKVEEHVSSTDARLTKVEEHVSSTDARLTKVEGQLDETNQIVKSILHRTEVFGAEISGLKVSTASKEFARRTEESLALLSARAATKEDLAEVRMHLIDEIDAVRTELKQDISELERKISDDLKSVFEIAGEHEVKIRTLMRRPV
ncbi:hypothetical protein [Sporolituus thermophilus]|uniref:Uncharacterized protein n=1 Tax=Sporolituus thermophilus DSM 23256 TaxID=1123285 RepID=A0A1G7MK60_9FIRM|nr:hypothetical protein [Sporolituus thermophilus]SDF62101.1 hypothetical protein SAMN05660235_02190 [Sporolituus thermophilus DSM 23256]